MYINEYGTAGAPVILGLHPMSITGEDLYEALKPHLTGEYCVITPDQGGHGKSGHYVSLEDEITTLKSYLTEKGYTDIRLLYGASMGVTAAYELLKDPTFHFERIWFDGAVFSDRPPSGMGFIKPAMRVILKFYDLFPGTITSSFVKHYGSFFGEKMKKNFLQLSDEDVVRIFTAIAECRMVEMPEETQQNMHLEWGEQDSGYKSSRPAVEKYLPGAHIVIREGYGHCTYMAMNTAKYVRELEDFIK